MSGPVKLLKLRASDAEDIQVISAVLQDSIAPVCDMAYQTDTKNFVMVVQRLRRETGEAGGCERICSALTVTNVLAVKTQNIDLAQTDRMLDLLAIMMEPQHIVLVFAGGAKIQLQTAQSAAALEDFGEPWPALCNPCHDSGQIAS